MLKLFLLRLGLTIGDCRITRVFTRGFGATDFRVGFRAGIIELTGAECESPFMSTGESFDPER